MSKHPHNPPDDTCVNCLLEQVPALRKQLAEARAGCCDRYGLSIAGLEDVSFCRKGGARIVCELVGDLRTALATKDLALAAAGVRELKLREALSLAQRWLSNCVPVLKIDGPTPLPVIAAALSAPTDTAALRQVVKRAVAAGIRFGTSTEGALYGIGNPDADLEIIADSVLSGGGA